MSNLRRACSSRRLAPRTVRPPGQQRLREVDVRGMSFREFLELNGVRPDELSLEQWLHWWGDDRA